MIFPNLYKGKTYQENRVSHGQVGEQVECGQFFVVRILETINKLKCIPSVSNSF